MWLNFNEEPAEDSTLFHWCFVFVNYDKLRTNDISIKQSLVCPADGSFFASVRIIFDRPSHFFSQRAVSELNESYNSQAYLCFRPSLERHIFLPSVNGNDKMELLKKLHRVKSHAEKMWTLNATKIQRWNIVLSSFNKWNAATSIGYYYEQSIPEENNVNMCYCLL